MKLIIVNTLSMLLFLFPALAENVITESEYKQAIINNHRQAIKEFTELAMVKVALMNANKNYANKNSGGLIKVMQLDSTWQVNRKLQKSVIQNPIAQKAIKLIENKEYEFTEIMLLNNVGVLVAAYPRTSDYWQGDEDKFQQPVILNGEYSGTTKWDQSTQTYSFFYCVLIRDNRDEIIGVLVSGLDVTKEHLNR